MRVVAEEGEAQPRPEAFLPAGAEAEAGAEEIRPAKAPQRAVAAAQPEAASEGGEAEVLRVLTLAPELPRPTAPTRTNENAACFA